MLHTVHYDLCFGSLNQVYQEDRADRPASPSMLVYQPIIHT